ncbi:MAG: hypothetical protein GX781_06950 [Clostridiales bacterium]|nr:hypothetical protein [Clostridiales bacterium]
MSKVSVSIHFTNELDGVMQTKHSQVQIGQEEGQLVPYDMMLGALGACYYATFIDIAKKMRLEYQRATIDIHGIKREEIPTTLKEVSMIFTIFGAAEEKGFERASSLAAKYCSVHETISRVADIKIELKFSPDAEG